MKRIPKSNAVSLLVFGAHPDDIEFGCGAVIARETRAGRTAHFVICSKGESATHGKPATRMREAKESAKILGSTVEFIQLDGDAHLESRVSHAVTIAGIIRRARPAIVLAPTLVENQHPDHPRLGRLVRDAARLARYGRVKELLRWPPHSIGQLFFYAITPDAEPTDISPVLVDISEPDIINAWQNAMAAHGSQISARKYVELQLTRARLNGLRCGVDLAIQLFPNDPIVLDSLEHLTRGTRGF